MVRHAIIPVAGLGTRILPLSYAIPKELLPLGHKPLLHWIAEELASNGLQHLILVTSPHKPDMDRLFRADHELSTRLLDKGLQAEHDSLWANGPYGHTQVSVVVQPQPLGLGHAITCGEPLCNQEPFVVALGDCAMGPPGRNQVLSRMLTVFAEQEADIVVALEWVPPERVTRYGIVDPVSADPNFPNSFRLQGIIEKPTVEQAPSQWAVAARYLFRQGVTADVESPESLAPGREIQLTTAIATTIARGGRVFGVPLAAHEQRFDVGSHNSYQRALRVFLDETT